MLGIVKKRKKLDKFVYQALRDVIKLGGDNVVQNFEEKFKELRVEGNGKEVNSSSVMFTEEDEYFDAEEMKEDDLDDEDQYESQIEDEDQETYFMGTQSQARKRFSNNRSRPMFRNRLNFNRRQSPYYTPNSDRLRSNPRAQNTNSRIFTNTQQTFTRCVGCRCTNCVQVKSDCQDIKKMLKKLRSTKIYEVTNSRHRC